MVLRAHHLYQLVFFVTWLGFSEIADAEVKVVSAHGFTIENQIKADASVDKVWQALTQNVDSWWPKDHSWWNGRFSIDATAGGCFCEILDDKSAEHMRIVFVDPEKTLRMVGGLGPLQGMGLYGAMDFKLSTTEQGGSTVSIHYSVHGMSENGFEQLATIVDQVQAIQLGGLKEYLSSN